MNSKIAQGNLQIIADALSKKENLNDTWKTYHDFINDGVMTIIALRNEIAKEHEDKCIQMQIAIDKSFEAKKSNVKALRLEQQIKELKQELERVKRTNEELLKGFE